MVLVYFIGFINLNVGYSSTKALVTVLLNTPSELVLAGFCTYVCVGGREGIALKKKGKKTQHRTTAIATHEFRGSVDVHHDVSSVMSAP